METPSGPAAPVLVIAKTAGLLARSFFPRSPSRPVGQWRPVSADDLLTVAGAAPASHRLPVSPHGEAPSTAGGPQPGGKATGLRPVGLSRGVSLRFRPPHNGPPVAARPELGRAAGRERGGR